MAFADRDTHAVFVHVKAELKRMEESGGMAEDWYEKWWRAWKTAAGGSPKKGPQAPPPQPSKPTFRRPQREKPTWAPDAALASRYWAQALHDRNAARKMGDDLVCLELQGLFGQFCLPTNRPERLDKRTNERECRSG